MKHKNSFLNKAGSILFVLLMTLNIFVGMGTAYATLDEVQTESITVSSYAVAICGDYIFVAPTSSNAIKKYWVSNFTDTGVTSSDLGGIGLDMESDGTYLYVITGADTRKLDPTDLSILATNTDIQDAGDITISGDYVYANANDDAKMYQMWKSNLTEKASYTITGKTPDSQDADGTYVYVGCQDGYLNKIQVSDMTEVDSVTGYSSRIQAVFYYDGYVYIAGQGDTKVWVYWASNLTKKGETDGAGFSGTIWDVIVDANYIYAIGDNDKVFAYFKDNLTKKGQSNDYTTNIYDACSNADSIFFDSGGTLVELSKGLAPSNQDPVISNPHPSDADATTDTSTLTWNCTIADPEGDTFSWWINVTASGFSQSSSGTLASNGSKTISLTGLTASKTYTVEVDAIDSNGGDATKTYTFSTVANFMPYYGTLNYANATTGVPLSAQWSLYIYDDNTFTYSIQCSNGQSKIQYSAVISGVKRYLDITGLLALTEYKIYVNVTDTGSPVKKAYWWFTFTTADGQAPSITNNAPIDPVLNFTWNCTIVDPTGKTFSYTLKCNNTDASSVTVGAGQTNGTKYLTITNLSFNTQYKVWANATNSIAKTTNQIFYFTTRDETPPYVSSISTVNNSINVSMYGILWGAYVRDAEYDSIDYTINCYNTTTAFNKYINGTKATGLGWAFMNLEQYGIGDGCSNELTALTKYTVVVTMTDAWETSDAYVYYFTTGYAPSEPVTPSLPTNITSGYIIFEFYDYGDDPKTQLTYTSFTFAHQYYNDTDITTMTIVEGTNLQINFTSMVVGSLFTVEFTNPYYIPSFTLGIGEYYFSYANTFFLAVNTTYEINLISLADDYAFTNTRSWSWCGLDDVIQIQSDKKEYYDGEQMVLRYKLPSISWLSSKGKNYLDYYLVMHNKDDAPFPTWYNGDIFSNDVWNLGGSSLFYGADWTYVRIEIGGDDSDIGVVPDGVTVYEINYASNRDNWWNNDRGTPDPLFTFRTLGEPLVPTGAIVDVNPSVPYVGQTIIINYTANNRGKFYFTDLNSLGSYAEPKEFDKPSGVNSIYHSFAVESEYKISLFVWDGYDYVEVTTALITCSSTGNDTTGRDIEYLECGKHYVAGYDEVEISYSSLLAYAKIVIVTPYGEVSKYGINTTTKLYGVHRFYIPSRSAIGRWTVTLYGEETLTSFFYISADEFNYIEFKQNEYYEGDAFTVLVTKNTNVVLIFKQYDDTQDIYIAKGNKYYLQGSAENKVYSFDLDSTKGDWRVELWETNSQVTIQLLSTSDCSVIAFPSTSGGYLSNPSILPSLDPTLGFIVGLIITMFCIVAPFGVSKALGNQGGIPSIVYVICGVLGISVSIILGFFPLWVIPAVLIAGVIATVLEYFIGRGFDNGDG